MNHCISSKYFLGSKIFFLSVILIALTVFIVQSLHIFVNQLTGLIFISGGFIWLPIVASYLFFLPRRNGSVRISSMYRCIIFVIAGFINMTIASHRLAPNEAGPTIIIFAIAIALQCMCIALFDFLLRLVRRFKQ